MKRIIHALSITLSIAACGEDTPEQTPPGPVTKSKAELAREAFWTSFPKGDYGDLPSITAKLEAAYAEDPNDGHNTFLLAHAHFWRLGELERDPNATEEDDVRHSMLARQYFQEAAALLPDDVRIPGWYAAMTFGLAAALGESPDPADQQLAGELQAEASEIMERGLQQFPIFYAALYGIILENAPAGSPPFDGAVEYYWAALDACLAGTMDREQPDFAALLARATDTGPSRICYSGGLAPHGFEGLMVRFGDVLVKHGDLDVAREVYAAAKMSPSYDTWRFQSAIDQRLSADLAARAALYRDEDERNDPSIGHTPEGCVACHGD